VAQDNADSRQPPVLWLAFAFVLAVGVTGLLLVADLLGQILAVWQERPPGVGWLKAGAAVQGVLLAVAVAVLIVGAARANRRRDAVFAEVLIVLVAIGCFFLTGWLQRQA
jgi:hypothetical protein